MFFSRSERAAAALVALALLAGAILFMIQRHSVRRARLDLEAYLIQRQVESAGLPEGAMDTGPLPSSPVSPMGPTQGGWPAPADGEGGGAGDVTPEAGLFVHVAGAVHRPGVYELPPGSRAIDGVEAAGGFASDADRNGLNLAAPIDDGQWLYVPFEGEGPSEGGWGAEGPPAAARAPGAGPGPVDVNRADAAGLQAVPGIGPVLADRILRYRAENGPFRSVDDLVNVKGIGAKTLEDIRPYVTVR